MKKLAIGLLVVVLIAAVALPVFGRGPGWGHGWGPGSCIGQTSDMRHGRTMAGYGFPDLNLTDEQRDKITSLRETHYKELAPLHRELFSKQTELKALWAQADPDKGAILAKQKEISALRDQGREKRTNHRFEMRKILTPEQLERLPLMGHGKGPGMRGGFGYGHGERFGARGDFGYGPCYGGGFRGLR